eukprot:367895_1
MQCLRPEEKYLVHGYFVLTFDQYTPKEIIDLCTLYCFVLDEFESNTANNIEVKGVNHCTAVIHAYLDRMPNGFMFTRNIIDTPGKYHWAFEVTNAQNATFDFQLWQSKYQSTKICSCGSQTNDVLTLHIYVDMATKTVVNKCGSKLETKKIGEDCDYDLDKCKLKILMMGHVQSTTIELKAYHDSFRYMQQLQHDPLETKKIGEDCDYDLDKCKLKILMMGHVQSTTIELKAYHDSFRYMQQ